jgi:hypothetical protein
MPAGPLGRLPNCLGSPGNKAYELDGPYDADVQSELPKTCGSVVRRHHTSTEQENVGTLKSGSISKSCIFGENQHSL